MEPEWTAENRNKTLGDTDFDTCGWCVHAVGVHQYDCCLSGRCELLPEHIDLAKISWDTSCRFKLLGAKDIHYYAHRMQQEADSLRMQASRADGRVAILTSLELSSDPNKPFLPYSRPATHFNIGDVVWLYFDNAWHRGTCVYGYRHHDGCVSAILDGTTKEVGGGISHPSVLREDEYNYFVEHPDEWRHWLLVCEMNASNKDGFGIECPKRKE